MIEIISRKNARARGWKFYFTGIPCINGHREIRYVSCGACMGCALNVQSRLREKRWASKKLSLRQIAKQEGETRYNTGLPCKHGHFHDRLTSNGMCLTCTKEKMKKTPELQRLMERRRRARKRNAPGRHTIDEINQLLTEQKFMCANPFCAADLRKVEKNLDHKNPLSRGGSDSVDNLQWLCRPCNGRKHARTMDAFLRAISP